MIYGNKVAKIKRTLLRNSSFQIARRMAGRYNSSEWPWKYLTKDQVFQLDRYNLRSIPLEQSDLDHLAMLDKYKSKRVNDIKSKKSSRGPIIVKYRDEDGEHEVKFTNAVEAEKWIKFMESKVSSGEEFELIE